MTDIRITDQHIRVYDDGRVVVLQKRITMTDTIAPALTPDEWAVRYVDRDESSLHRNRLHRLNNSHTLIVTERDERGDETRGATVYQQALPAVIAAANAALPDDSEYKITRADVAMLRALAEAKVAADASDDYYMHNAVDTSAIGDVGTLAAKLAALLPPK